MLKSYRVLFAALCLGILGCGPEEVPAPEVPAVRKTAPETEAVPGKSLSLAAVGDVAPPYPADRAASFGAAFASARPRLQRADLSIGFLDARIGADDGSVPGSAPSGFAAALYGSGIDVLAFPSKHVYGAGIEGARATAAFLALAERGIAGIVPESGFQTGLRVVRGSVSVAILAYADPESPLAPERPEADPYPGRYNGRMAQLDVKQARVDSDFVVVMVRWGTRTDPGPTDRMRAIARTLVFAGADAVVGSGPCADLGHELVDRSAVIYAPGPSLYRIDLHENAPPVVTRGGEGPGGAAEGCR